jgi:endoglucanase
MPPTDTPEPPTELVTLQRGVNFGNMLEPPSEGEWGLTVHEEYFDLVKEAGFDFVRLPVSWSTHTERVGYDDGNVGYQITPEFFARVDEVVNWALERDLKIIIDFHHYNDLMSDPNEEQFLFMWRQIAEHYKEYPPQVIFELLNEPNGNLTAPLWNIYLHDALSIIRESNPTRDVIIGPVSWNAYDWLYTLDVPNDDHLIVTFHYYLPFHFTHQGAEWAGEEAQKWLGTEWGTDAEKAEVVSHFDSVADWAGRHGNVHILLGEFGAYSRGPQDSRVRWTGFVREQAEAHGFAWAYWELAAGFGVYDPDARVWREDLLKALIP